MSAARYPYGYVTDAPEPRPWRVWGGSTAMLGVFLVGVVSCNGDANDDNDQPVSTTSVQVSAVAATDAPAAVRREGFLTAPGVVATGLGERAVDSIAEIGCRTLRDAGATRDTVLLHLARAIDEVQAVRRTLSDHDAAVIIGAGSIVHCPEYTEMLAGLGG